MQLTQNIQLKASNCTTSVLAAGNKTPLSQSAGSRSASQVGSVASSLDLSIDALTPNSNTSSLQNQPTISKEKKSKKKKVWNSYDLNILPTLISRMKKHFCTLTTIIPI